LPRRHRSRQPAGMSWCQRPHILGSSRAVSSWPRRMAKARRGCGCSS
jgi:hypothetical protein